MSRHPSAIAPYVELLHLPPVLVVLLAAAGFTAAAVGGPPPPQRIGPFLGALFFTQVAISLHNDYCDRALDAATKPWRALPRGLVAPRTIAWTAAGLFAGGLLIAVPLGPLGVALIALGTSAGFVYNAWLKRTAWSWLPFWVALPSLAICAFVVAGRHDDRLWLGYAIGAPLVVSVHLADTLADIDADFQAGVRGLAHRLGPTWTLLACSACLAAAHAMALALWPQPGAPGPLFALAAAVLGLAGVAGAFRSFRGHWLAIMLSATTLAVAWLQALSA